MWAVQDWVVWKCSESPSVFFPLHFSSLLGSDKQINGAKMPKCFSKVSEKRVGFTVPLTKVVTHWNYSHLKALFPLPTPTLSYTWRRKIFPRHWKYTVQREYLYEEILLRILLTQSFKCPLLILFKIEKLSIFIILCSLYNRNYLIDSLKMQIILKEENINHSSVICWEMCVFPDRWQEIGNLELKWFQ